MTKLIILGGALASIALLLKGGTSSTPSASAKVHESVLEIDNATPLEDLQFQAWLAEMKFTVTKRSVPYANTVRYEVVGSKGFQVGLHSQIAPIPFFVNASMVK